MKAQLVSVIGLALTACQGSEPPIGSGTPNNRPDIPDNVRPNSAREWTLSCLNGQGLVVTFDHPRQMATVRRSDGMAFDLVQASVSHGYRYFATETELHGDGKTATWRAPRVSDTTCQVAEIKPLRGR